MKKRKVYPGEVHHVCQQTIDGVLVFYSVSDYLVFFTIYCTVARRCNIPVLALCPMVDHLHNTVIAPDNTSLSRFVQQYTHLFAREWNESRGRKGPLFKHRYMSSVKLGNKQVKTTINYNFNNPVERKMVEKAEEYRWNFLRYAQEKAPYSAKLDIGKKSWKFRSVYNEVKRIYTGGGHLRYEQLKRWKRMLSPGELQQIVDYAINLWNVIDYKETVSYYGDLETMIRSFHDNTGSDYSIKEDHNNYSDSVYKDCTAILLKEYRISDVTEIPSLPDDVKRELVPLLCNRTSARLRQIEKYLHLPPHTMQRTPAAGQQASDTQ